MGKRNKKKNSKKDGVSDDIIDGAALSIKRFRKVTNEIAKLSTGQKLVGSLALVAAGYLYYDKLKREGGQITYHGFTFPLPQLAAAKEASITEEIDAEVVSPPKAVAAHKNHKSPKARKPRPDFGRKPAASPDDE
ncbi:hypothetical protein [Hymenobacter sp. BT730]|uniref:hypothetical protein n=1 Tax=Hymenobacter sp. BT730 TaxID=3063332 RepID=UPI0026DEB959|nr:hypothetical protein [Hymenobacter sp. BT730]